MKLGFEDVVPDEGLDAEAAIEGAALLADAGLDAIEVSANLMQRLRQRLDPGVRRRRSAAAPRRTCW